MVGTWGWFSWMLFQTPAGTGAWVAWWGEGVAVSQEQGVGWVEVVHDPSEQTWDVVGARGVLRLVSDGERATGLAHGR